MHINCLVGIAISANPEGTLWNNNEKIKFTSISLGQNLILLEEF